MADAEVSEFTQTKQATAKRSMNLSKIITKWLQYLSNIHVNNVAVENIYNRYDVFALAWLKYKMFSII